MRRVTRARLVVSLAFFAASIGPARGQDSISETRRKVAELEAKVAGLPPGSFDFGLHNELRHLYGGLDERKSMIQCDIIFRNSFLDDYMFQVLGGKDPVPSKAIQALTAVAKRYPDLPNLAAACWIRAGDLVMATDRTMARAYYLRAGQIRDATARYREAAQDRLILPTGSRTPWPSRIPAPADGRRSPGPWNDPADTTLWPNQRSRANSDPWLAEHHDQIKRMRPRVLIVNFSNEHTAEHLMGLVNQMIQCLAEASRYHGHTDLKAPAFLQYQVFKMVDLRDPDSTRGDSHLVPLKPRTPDGSDVKYRAFFTDDFARAWRVPDPRPGAKGRLLRLDELVDGGYVHEVWFFTSGTEDPERRIRALEVVEMKPRYDEAFRKQGEQFVQAGNGGDADQPWTGRSVRIGCINASRGPGCFLESLSHGMEGTANSGAIPYFTRYFHEYAGFDLKARYGLPFDSLYGADFGQTPIRYPEERTMIVTHQGKEYRVANYIPAGGNVHFPPNARGHYDQDNPEPVLSTIENWRIGRGQGGRDRDRARPFSSAVLLRNRDLAPDCMGAWLVYWRQNMPGLNNRQKDDQGHAMKNWWPFLFY